MNIIETELNDYPQFKKKVSFHDKTTKLKKELKTLIKTWDKYTKDLRIFLFVDDIDRYSEKKIIQSINS
ncbi:P-loop NTPase fold protein [Bacteroides fragilis]|uniref:P-loop NTPase fold protein n=1 Tax=Bacteroides fragilis TaxID=817 RepID=UPI0005B39477|nr:P-loop NTPase fold protein [Bacteroides fragilis]MDU7595088.1 P-loop NTPase fold protein [Bacteroides fragilis]RHK13317.1 hypothetical protein DW078_20085 [Bacteroides fragilis]WPC91026.1 P-loop NTPase fold protein [Bacteroides fragilis]